MSGRGRRSARGRAVGLILAGLAAGSILGGPAAAHVGHKIGHLTTKHLDAIYLNENQKAADSNQLDGLDSTAFLRKTGKAADSDLLDGVNSTGFLAATGKAVDADKLDGVDSTAFLQGTSTLSGTVSCAGSGFYPVDGGDSGDEVNDSEGERYLLPGTGALRCAISLPSGATVTGVRFTVFDGVAAPDVDSCRLLRTDLTDPVAAESNVSTPVSTTGDVDEEVITAPSLVAGNALVANGGFGYSFECSLESGDSDNGIYGAVATYTVPASAG